MSELNIELIEEQSRAVIPGPWQAHWNDKTDLEKRNETFETIYAIDNLRESVRVLCAEVRWLRDGRKSPQKT